MIKADASKVLDETAGASVRGCEVVIKGEYAQIMGEYKALTTSFIDSVVKRAPDEHKYKVANDIVDIFESGVNQVAKFIIRGE